MSSPQPDGAGGSCLGGGRTGGGAHHGPGSPAVVSRWHISSARAHHSEDGRLSAVSDPDAGRDSGYLCQGTTRRFYGGSSPVLLSEPGGTVLTAWGVRRESPPGTCNPRGNGPSADVNSGGRSRPQSELSARESSPMSVPEGAGLPAWHRCHTIRPTSPSVLDHRQNRAGFGSRGAMIGGRTAGPFRCAAVM